MEQRTATQQGSLIRLLNDEHKLFWLLQIGGWIGFAMVNFLSGMIHGKSLYYSVPTLIYMIIGLVLSLGLRSIYHYLWQRPWAVIVSVALPAMVVAATLFSVLQTASFVNIYPTKWQPEDWTDYLHDLPFALYVFLAWSALYFGIKYYRMLQRQSEKTLKASAMAHEAQVKMLRYQLNPHFLFNTLNAISTLILEQDHRTANAMVSSLSAFLRHSLYQHPTQKVSLNKELDALNLYLSIEKTRFPERLRVTQDISEEARSALVPSMILQPLIENAVKYAVAPREEGGHITVQAVVLADQLLLSVCDDGPGCDVPPDLPPENGKGVGLHNSRERLRVLYGNDAGLETRRIQPHGLCVTLKLPYEQGSGDGAQRSHS
ncbi:MAG: histidine kinase [Wenzhouxiangellaceae bacterium]